MSLIDARELLEARIQDAISSFESEFSGLMVESVTIGHKVVAEPLNHRYVRRNDGVRCVVVMSDEPYTLE